MADTKPATETGGKQTIVHEHSYSRRNPTGIVHRARLRTILDVMNRFVPRSARSWADFGCSNGFIIEQVTQSGRFDFGRIVGYDHSKDLLELAANKRIPNSDFHQFDLNSVHPAREQFEIVTCFETLEHVGDYRSAFENIYNHLADAGILVVTVPDETGVRGVVKLAGRRILRRTTDNEFFARNSEATYVRCLLRNGYIDGFRDPSAKGYGSHLGFDYRRLYEFIAKEFVANGHLVEITKMSTSLGMNKVAVYRRE